MRTMLRNLTLTLAGMALCLVFLELALRILPVRSDSDMGYHVDPLIMTYRPQQIFRTSEGWSLAHATVQHANNLGFLSTQDFVPNARAVAVIGDSFVDGSMLDERYRLGEQTQGLSPQRPIYALGGPGSSLLDYGERMRFAAEKLAIKDFVLIMVAGDVEGSYCGSTDIHGPCIDRSSGESRTQRHAPPGQVKQYLRHSALMQYLYANLHLKPDQLLHNVATMFYPPPRDGLKK